MNVPTKPPFSFNEIMLPFDDFSKIETILFQKFNASESIILTSTPRLKSHFFAEFHKREKTFCMCCNDGVTEATEQLPNESGLYVCYACKIAQKEVVPIPSQ